MKRILLIFLLCAWAAALAQTPPDENAAAEPDAALEQPAEDDESQAEDELDEEEMTEAEKAAKAMADEDFKPGDEISEDYPVPLPSDI